MSGFVIIIKLKLKNILNKVKMKSNFTSYDIYCQMSDSNKHFDDYKSCILPG